MLQHDYIEAKGIIWHIFHTNDEWMARYFAHLIGGTICRTEQLRQFVADSKL